MTPRIQITLLIILAIAVGSGAIVFGLLIVTCGRMFSDEATISAAGATILVAGVSGLFAHAKGCFHELDDRDM